MMNIQKMILVGGVAVVAALFSPAAQARDHHHDRDDRDRHDFHHHHGNFDRHYYEGRRTVIYNDPYYYADPTPGVTFAFGGHRQYRHWHHR